MLEWINSSFILKIPQVVFVLPVGILLLWHAPPVSWPAYSGANENAPSVNMASDFRWRCAVLLLSTLLLCILAAESKDKPKKKKDIRDYNDADMARLLEQWEVRSRVGSVSQTWASC